MKKFLIILVLIIAAVYAGMVYLNQTILPTKIKSAIVKNLEDVTQKKTLLGSVQFDIFKGLILKDLIIRDDLNAIINVKEVRCRFLLLPLFSKHVIISRLTFESPEIFVERRADYSLNIPELFSKESMVNTDFKVLVQRISVRKASVNFHDLTMDPIFTREIKGLDADIYFKLPAKLKYEANFEIEADLPVKIELIGEYSPVTKEYEAEVKVRDFAPKEFARFYENTGLAFPEGRIDSVLKIKYKNETLSVDAESEIKSLQIIMDKISAEVSGSERSTIRYNFTEKKLDYTGAAEVTNMNISGLDNIGKIENTKGHIEFSNLGISSENITATVLGLPISAKISINDFDKPVMDIDAYSDVKLAPFQRMLKEKFALDIPAELSGDAKLHLTIEYPFAVPQETRLTGTLNMPDAVINIDNGKVILEDVSGELKFAPDQVSWDDAEFKYRDIVYRSSGVLTDFNNPRIQLKLDSKDIFLDTTFAVNGKELGFSRIFGKYHNSDILASGTIDSSDSAKMNASMNGVVNVNVEDLKQPLEKFKDKFEKAKLRGIVRAEFNLNGNLKDFKSCAVEANLSSDNLSLYGYKLLALKMKYAQKNSVSDILSLHSLLYGGSMDATGRIDWVVKDAPYHFNADIEGVKIEKLKADTDFKDKDVAGSVRSHVKLNGFVNNTEKLSGEGRLAITEGKLWQLNLFRGLGTMLFTSDFSEIIFKEGRCDFKIGGKSIYTNELVFKSDLVKILGPIKIGFDNSVKATFKAEFSEDALEAGMKKDITTAVGKYTYIDVYGTLKDPQYKVRPDVVNIVQSIAENIADRLSEGQEY
ncbi:MAG: DUF3971 domain-containing protein [Candidatus Omnitrophota bacterium]